MKWGLPFIQVRTRKTPLTFTKWGRLPVRKWWLKEGLYELPPKLPNQFMALNIWGQGDAVTNL